MVNIVKQISMSLSLHFILRRNTYYEVGLKRISTISINHSRFGGVRGLDRLCNKPPPGPRVLLANQTTQPASTILQPKSESCWLKEEGVGSKKRCGSLQIIGIYWLLSWTIACKAMLYSRNLEAKGFILY